MKKNAGKLILIAGLTLSAHGVFAQAPIREEYLPLARMLSTSPESVPTEGNSVEFIEDGDHLVFSLIQDILQARKSVHVQFYEFTTELHIVRSALKLKAMDGADVLFIAEDLHQRPHFINGMKDCGVRVLHYRPQAGHHRNHRKIVVIDGTVAYAGGSNLEASNIYEWDDTNIRITGPSVLSLDETFMKMWRHLGGGAPAWADERVPGQGSVVIQSVADAPLDGKTLNLDAYLWALDNAKEYFHARTPYFAPPRKLRDAMKRAAARGVDVKIIIPDRSDFRWMDAVNRTYVEELADAGVKIYFREDVFDHSKVFVSDGYLSSIGSVNLDNQSLRRNYENNLYFYDESMAREMEARFSSALSGSRELSAGEGSVGLLRIVAPLL